MLYLLRPIWPLHCCVIRLHAPAYNSGERNRYFPPSPGFKFAIVNEAQDDPAVHAARHGVLEGHYRYSKCGVEGGGERHYDLGDA